nr:putative lrr receptor-like serine/threonine-protein kinase [Quercus suber]
MSVIGEAALSGFSVMELCRISFLLFWAFQLVHAQQTTDPNEVDALKKIIIHWNLSGKLNLTTDPCSQNAPWAPDNANPRMACDCTGSTCHITQLKIYALDIFGEIPQELFLLKELMDLNLGQNVLSGPLPAEIGQLSKIQYLSLGINNLTGPVPPELGNLSKLISLSLSANNFNGTLPTQLGMLTSLQRLYIDSSGVSGPIPQELASLKVLQTLWASDNGFTGMLPEFFGTLTELIDLRLQGTSLEGPIPRSFGALTKLVNLRIGDLSKEDSTLDFLENQTSLSILSLRNCRVSGEIPEWIGTFAKLQYLDLSFNKLTGQIPNSFQNFSLLQNLDVSFNPITGNLPPNFAKAGFSMNVLGTSINANSLPDRKAIGMLHCLQNECTNQVQASSFSIKCGGMEQTSSSGIKFDNDSESLGAASLYTNSNDQWAVSNTGNFISNPNGPQYMNGKYNVELHFAEITMDDSQSWKGLGRRLFDIYIQGERVVQDFNIQKEAGGSKRALIKTFEANVTNTIIEVHFFWAGKGTCCIPFQSTYGPLVSAVHVYQGYSSKRRNRSFIVVVAGIAGTIAVIFVMIICYLKREQLSNMGVISKKKTKDNQYAKAFVMNEGSLAPKQYTSKYPAGGDHFCKKKTPSFVEARLEGFQLTQS